MNFSQKRLMQLVKGKKGSARKEMFGGMAYLFNGNMCVEVDKNEMIIRYDPKITEEIQADKNVHSFDIRGRPMKGGSLAGSEGVQGVGLKKWFDLSFSFVKSITF